MSEVKTNKISPRSGTAFTLGDSGDTFSIPSGGEIDIASGATLDINGTVDFAGATVSNLSAGKIGQVLFGTQTGSNTVTTAAYVDTGLNVTITPSATSSKIILMLNGPDWDSAGDGSRGLVQKFYKNVGGAGDAAIDASLTEYRWPYFSIIPYCRTYIDSPSTTSAIEYSLYVQAVTNTVYYFRDGRTYQLIAMEVLA